MSIVMVRIWLLFPLEMLIDRSPDDLRGAKPFAPGLRVESLP
jgi:hypothetical protein